MHETMTLNVDLDLSSNHLTPMLICQILWKSDAYFQDITGRIINEPIDRGAQSTLRGKIFFAGKYMYEKLTKCLNFPWYLPEKITMHEFYMIVAQNNIPSILGVMSPSHWLIHLRINQPTNKLACMTLISMNWLTQQLIPGSRQCWRAELVWDLDVAEHRVASTECFHR